MGDLKYNEYDRIQQCYTLNRFNVPLWAVKQRINEPNAVKQFIDLCNNIGSTCSARRNISQTTAVKFLYARKFDITRAVSLYEQHEQIRLKEGLYNIDPDAEPLYSELKTGKFTILPARDSSGAAIALFTANKHSPLNVTHTTTLQGIVYQLDCALQDTETQKAGLVFIYDMSGSKYSNFDYDLSQKILTLLKVSVYISFSLFYNS
uniref:CRAL-TRIO domain-containing protein n=1 Tax=Glossina palpalis gambiensis TaxID=67801 RepID=A0A1B0BJU8_9MUSC